MKDVTDTLLVDGLAQFAAAIENLERAIDEKRAALLEERIERPTNNSVEV